jgi:K+ transporter
MQVRHGSRQQLQQLFIPIFLNSMLFMTIFKMVFS